MLDSTKLNYVRRWIFFPKMFPCAGICCSIRFFPHDESLCEWRGQQKERKHQRWTKDSKKMSNSGFHKCHWGAKELNKKNCILGGKKRSFGCFVTPKRVDLEQSKANSVTSSRKNTINKAQCREAGALKVYFSHQKGYNLNVWDGEANRNSFRNFKSLLNQSQVSVCVDFGFARNTL